MKVSDITQKAISFWLQILSTNAIEYKFKVRWKWNADLPSSYLLPQLHVETYCDLESENHE